MLQSVRVSRTTMTQPTKVAGTLRRAVRWSELTVLPGERHMECVYYFDFVGFVHLTLNEKLVS